jgi:hypothetical protein
LEVSTGFLIGPRFDSHLFYVKPSRAAVWQKSYADSAYRKQAQGRLLGVTLGGFDEPVAELKARGFNFARVELQTKDRTLFEASGRLDAAVLPHFSRLLDQTAEAGIAVELVLFHPGRDEMFDTPEAILDAARRLTDWLIDRDYRHVLLNPANQWQSPGWDFDHFVPQNLERIAQAIRDRFQQRRTDFALPIALSAPMTADVNRGLAEEADVLIAPGGGPRIDPRRVKRPVLIEHDDPQECAALFERFAGCLASGPANSGALAPLVLRSPRQTQ